MKNVIVRLFCPVMFVFQIFAPVCIGQLKYSDVVAGFNENVEKISATEFQFLNRMSLSYSDTYKTQLEQSIKEIKEFQPNAKLERVIVDSMVDSLLQSLYDFELPEGDSAINAFEFTKCDNGQAIRLSSFEKVEFNPLSGQIDRVVQAATDFYGDYRMPANRELDFSFIQNGIGRTEHTQFVAAFASGDTNLKKRLGEEKILFPIKVHLSGNGVLRDGAKSMTDVAYAAKAPNVTEIVVDGDIVLIELDDIFVADNGPGLFVKRLVRFELDMSMGFLPTKIQYSKYLERDGVKFQGRARSRWENELNFTNKEISPGVFLPVRVESIALVDVFGASEQELYESKDWEDFQGLVCALSDLKLNSSENCLATYRSYDLTWNFNADEFDDPANFLPTPPANCILVVDDRTGEKKVNRVVADTLILDLKESAESASSFPWVRISIFGMLMIIFVGIAYVFTRKKEK